MNTKPDIKAVFFDIDGTLVSLETHKINQSTIESIKTLHSKGIKIFISTGRPKIIINNIKPLEELGVISGYITMNGACCFLGDRVIYKKPIDKDSVKTIAHYCKEHNIACVFVEEDRMFISQPNEVSAYVMQGVINVGEIPTEEYSPDLHKDIFQITPFMTTEQEQEMRKHIADCEITRWLPVFADITHIDNSKKNGIIHICKHIDTTAEHIMAFGDGGNDISMLSYAAVSVAMGQAKEEVKAVATHITDTPENDGIYKALLHYDLL